MVDHPREEEEAAMADLSSNRALLAQIADGSAEFEMVCGKERLQLCPAFATISEACFSHSSNKRVGFFAKIGFPSERKLSPPAIRKVEHHIVHKVEGDGRCLFRALVLGMATNKGIHFTSVEEQHEADQLRLAVRDVLCNNDKRRQDFEEALIAITIEESMTKYCQRISKSNFWGGESELLVLSKMCGQSIIIYVPEAEVKNGTKWRTGFIPIAEYGSEFTKLGKDRKPRKPVRLLYSGGNHYDLLI